MHERAREILAATGRRARSPRGSGPASSRPDDRLAHRAGFVALVGPPERRQVDAAQPAGGREDGHRLAAAPDDAHPHHRASATCPTPRSIFVDTPGLHAGHGRLGELMRKTAERALEDVDLVCFVVEATERPDAPRPRRPRPARGLRARRSSAASTRPTWSRPKSRLLPADRRLPRAPIRSRRSCRSRPRRGDELRPPARPDRGGPAGAPAATSRRDVAHRSAGDLLGGRGHPREDLPPHPPGGALRLRGAGRGADGAQAARVPVHPGDHLRGAATRRRAS